MPRRTLIREFSLPAARAGTSSAAPTLARNVLSGNSQYGIFITDSNTTRNVVLGNYIGTAAGGSNALANGDSGVFIGNGASSNTIGGTVARARNIVSGNVQYGIFLTNTTGNVISGNYLGVNAGGEIALANQKSGVALFGGTQNIIGGTVTGAGNVLSGNGEYGIDIRNPVATGNFVQGNLVGLDATGTNAIANVLGGVHLDGGASTTPSAERSPAHATSFPATSLPGFSFTDPGPAAISSRAITSAPTSPAPMPFPTRSPASTRPLRAPPAISSAAPSPVRATSFPATIMAFISPTRPATGNLVEGNYIGVSPDGTRAVGSAFTGIIIFAGATNNTVGGTAAGAGNVISGCWGYGVYISDAGTSGNLVQGNIIGADLTGTSALGNGYANVFLQLGATNNAIGGTGAGAGNEIAFSGGAGVLLLDANTTNNTIRGNSIFANGFLGIDFNNDGVTLNDTGYPTPARTTFRISPSSPTPSATPPAPSSWEN